MGNKKLPYILYSMYLRLENRKRINVKNSKLYANFEYICWCSVNCFPILQMHFQVSKIVWNLIRNILLRYKLIFYFSHNFGYFWNNPWKVNNNSENNKSDDTKINSYITKYKKWNFLVQTMNVFFVSPKKIPLLAEAML